MLSPVTIYSLFFLSGFSGLLFEVVWFRLMLRTLGESTLASACVLTAFMGGLALGAWLSELPLVRRCSPLRLYAALELTAALSGILVPALLSGDVSERLWLPIQAWAQGTIFEGIVRFSIALAVLIVPCTAMGATYLTLSRFLSERLRRGSFATLYGANLAGAFSGALTTGFVLLPGAGLFLTSSTGAAVAAAVAALATYLSTKQRADGSPSNVGPGDPAQLRIPQVCEPRDGTSAAGAGDEELLGGMSPAPYEPGFREKPRQPQSRGQILALSCLVAAAAVVSLVMQTCLYRMFFLLLGSSVYSSSAVLASTLLGLSWAPLVAGGIRKESTGKLLMVIALFCCGIGAALPAFAASYIPWLFVVLSQNLPALDPVFIKVVIIAILVVPFFGFSGAVFPLAVLAASDQENRRRRATGTMYLASCLGSIAGAAGGALAVPGLMAHCQSGIIACPRLLSAVMFCMAALAASLLPSGIRRLASATAAAAGIAAVVLVTPIEDPALMSLGVAFFERDTIESMTADVLLPRLGKSAEHRGWPRVLFYREGLNSTITVTEASNLVSLRNDGKVEASLPASRQHPAPGSDLSTHTLLAALPILFHHGPASDVLLVGYGSGTTAHSLFIFPEVESLIASELEPAVLEAGAIMREFNGAKLKNSLKHEKKETSLQERLHGSTSIVRNDARNVLSLMNLRYDVIICQGADPWVAGSTDLYTREFWKLTRRRLAKNGICCQWIPLYGVAPVFLERILSTFASVYPDTLICHSPGAGELILLGFTSPARLSVDDIDNRLNHSYLSRLVLATAGIGTAEDALACIKTAAARIPAIARARPLTDDNLGLEFACASSLSMGSRTIKDNLAWLFDPARCEPDSIASIETLPQTSSYLLSTLGRCFAAQSLEASNASGFNGRIARCLTERALTGRRCPYTVWNFQVVARALGEQSSEDGSVSGNANHRLDRLALVDDRLYRQRFHEALALLRDAPKEPAFTERRAWALLGLGSPREALAQVKHLKSFASTSLGSLLLRYYAQLALGAREEAANSLRQYLSINPWNPQVHLALTATLLDCFEEESRYPRTPSPGETKQAGRDSAPLEEAIAHARDYSLLRAHDAGAMLLVLDRLDRAGFKDRFRALVRDSQSLLASCPATRCLVNTLDPMTSLKAERTASFIKKLEEEATSPDYGYKLFGSP